MSTASDDPNDPQNWSATKKNLQLLVLSEFGFVSLEPSTRKPEIERSDKPAMAAFVPDFSSGLGIGSLFELAKAFDTTVDEINNLTSNWSIFCLGPGGILAVILIKRYGRLPVLFWSQLLGLGFLIGCAAAPNLHVFAAMRILNALFSTAPQCVGLWTGASFFSKSCSWPARETSTIDKGASVFFSSSVRHVPFPFASSQARYLDVRVHRLAFRVPFPPRVPRGLERLIPGRLLGKLILSLREPSRRVER